MNVIKEITQQSEKDPRKVVNIRVIITSDFEVDERTSDSLDKNLSAMASWLLRRLKEKE